MALETAPYVNGLVSANPPAGDPVTQADDHLRLIKSALLNTFPNLNGPVTATPAQLNQGVPTGCVIPFVGTVAPTGWGLCDGSTYAKVDGSGNITSPDMRGRTVLGSNGSFPLNTSGGSYGGVTGAAGAHGHTGSTDYQGAHSHGGATQYHTLSIAEMPSHNHTFTASVGFANRAGADSNCGSVPSGGNSTDYTGGNGGHNHGIDADGVHAHNVTVGSVGDHTHTVTTAQQPYVAMNFIMKL